MLTVVPPTSATKAVSFFFSRDSKFARKFAPRMELVGPLEKVLIGNLAAISHVMRVPSLEVRKSGHDRLRVRIDSRKPSTVWLAKASKPALRIVAFSLCKRPNTVSARSLSLRHESAYQYWRLPC